jgi:hypothetical protein
VVRFWWIIKKALEKFWCIGSLLGVPLCMVEVIYFHIVSFLHSLDCMWRFKQSSLLEYY